MKKRLLSIILTLALCLSLLPTAALAADSGDIYPDEADASGNIIASSDRGGSNFSRSGPIYEGSDGDETFNGGTFYIIQGNVTIGGNLTIGGDAYGGLVLCKGATLTVEGALIRTSNNEYYIYGQSDKGENAGRLIIKNSKDNGAAIRSTNSTAPQLRMSSGELEIYGGKSGKLVDNVKLYSTYKSSSIHKGTLDGKEVSPAEWEKTSVDGQKLVIEYCKHDNADNIKYISDGSSTHHKHCKSCGFTWQSEDHDIATVPTGDGQYHTTGCKKCDYKNSGRENHTWVDGECTGCHFKPVAGGAFTELYGSVQAALDDVAKGNTTYAELCPGVKDSPAVENQTIDFNYPNKTAELKMKGYALSNSSITVRDGTLKITGDTINISNSSGVAISVTGGKLVFNGVLTATGASGKRAVEVTGGELTLKAGDVLNGGVSVVGSDNYNSVNALLGEKLAFATQDGDITTIVNGNGKSISGNLTVVEHEHIYTDGKCACGAECPHSSIDDATGKCAACEKTFLAVVNDTRFSTSMASAISFWVTKGGTMKLYADAGLNAVNFTAASADKAYTIDLNGHRINYTDHDGKSTEIHLNGVNLTIQDTKQSSNGAFGPIVADSGSLTLDNGTLKGLTVPEGSTAAVTLRGGTVSAINSAKPIYTLMPNGYALMQGPRTVDPAESLSGTNGYDIKDAQTQFVSSEKTGSTAFGSQTIPFDLRLTTNDSKVGLMSFKWYRIDSTGKAVKLAGFTQDETPVKGVYTFNPDHVEINADGWEGMTADNTYDVICVVTGKTSNASHQWQTALGGYELTVTQASIANADVTVADNLTYDGTAQSPTVTVKLGGKELTQDTDYTVSGNSQTNAGEYTLKITGTGNYSGEKTAAWSIAPKPVTNATVNVIGGPFTYTGEEIKPGVTVMDGATVIEANEFTVSYGNNINAGDNTATVTIKNKNGGNYTISNVSTTFTINKAVAPTGAKRGSLTVVNNHAKTYTVDLAALLPELNYGDRIEYVIVSDSMDTLGDYYTKGATVSDGILTLPTNAVNTGRTDKIGTITVEVFSTNYQKIELSIDVYATNKTLPIGTPTLSKTAITYGEALSTITLSGVLNDGQTEVPGTFAWVNGATVPDASASYQAGWTFTPNDNEKYQGTSGTVKITVNKATPTGEPKYTAITTSGKKLSDAGLTTEGGTFSVAGTVQWVGADGAELSGETEVKANTAYKWVFTPESENYNAIEGSITLYPVSSGGGSSKPSYSVNTPGKTENGSVSLSTKNAVKGSTVTVTVQPESGYVLEKLVVTDKDGKQLAVTDLGNGKYSFVMPAGTVKVEASFTEQAKAPAFADVSAEDYYYAPVQWALERGITDGISEDLFGPNQPCTRAQIVTFLWRAAGSPAPKGTSSFADVPAESYYAQAVAWAVENGITTGTGEGTFSPNAPCDRAQSVTFLFRALGGETEGGANFSDVSAESYYADAVAWAAEQGITNGTSSTTFSPNEICTRGQIVTFLYRGYQGK